MAPNQRHRHSGPRGVSSELQRAARCRYAPPRQQEMFTSAGRALEPCTNYRLSSAESAKCMERHERHAVGPCRTAGTGLHCSVTTGGEATGHHDGYLHHHRHARPQRRGSMLTMRDAKLVLCFAILVGLLVQVLLASDEILGCNIVCGRDYNPVCGVQQGVLKTFSNLCMMTYFNCRNGSDFQLIYKDDCPENSTQATLI